MQPARGKISVIIPALDEAERIALALASIGASPDVERIVVDGGSRDRTAEIARSCGAEVLLSLPGRAIQMNAGARVATGDYLLFLHADTTLLPAFDAVVRRILELPGVVAGAFQLRINSSRRSLRWVEKAANWRARVLRMPYGDQGLFLKASRFRDLGGFREIPLLEDVEFVRRLRRCGEIAIAPAAAVTSARRWERRGVFTVTLWNQVFLLAYFLGVPPARIAQWYYRRS